MSTFSYKRALKRIEEKQQQEVEIIEEVEIVEETKEVEEVKLHICPICNKEYKTKRGLEKHLESKHKGGE